MHKRTFKQQNAAGSFSYALGPATACSATLQCSCSAPEPCLSEEDVGEVGQDLQPDLACRVLQVLGILEQRSGEDSFKRILEGIVTQACRAISGTAKT